MAICGNCGAEGSRIRSRWIRGVQIPDECPQCAPQDFEKQTDPSDKKIWIAPEVRPNDYTKVYDEDGPIYMPKPEVTAELEAKVFDNSEEREKYEEALAKKRAERRTRPLSEVELMQALRHVDQYLRPMIEDQVTAYDV
jgi:hypothetical protein